MASNAAAQAAAVPEWRYLIGLGLRNEVLPRPFQSHCTVQQSEPKHGSVPNKQACAAR